MSCDNGILDTQGAKASTIDVLRCKEHLDWQCPLTLPCHHSRDDNPLTHNRANWIRWQIYRFILIYGKISAEYFGNGHKTRKASPLDEAKLLLFVYLLVFCFADEAVTKD